MNNLSLSSRKNGVALVIVLCVVLLITALITAFFAATQMEAQSSSSQEHLSELQRLRELPLEIVETQIHGATTLGGTGTLANITNTWASQPGLIRVFNNQGNLARAYKLYSSGTMEATDTGFLATEIPSNWNTQTNRYVNLNQPFPSTTASGTTTYPILDPAAQTWAEGLTVAADPSGQNAAAMPVEWLYVLKDGSIVPQSQVTGTNPPTARIAFWTDDESCKININTAGERTFWDRPRSGHDKCISFMYNQPSTGEYNAYPGHPATVSLSAAFSNALTTGTTPDAHSSIVQEMLSLTPRYAWGGSQDGSIPTYNTRTILDRTKTGAVIKNDRLYATASELLFTPSRLNVSGTDPRLKDPIQKSEFLLTASSRAPELNLFGTPRIGLWPIDGSADKTRRTVYDKLIARGTTIGSQPFYFQRIDPMVTNEAENISRNWTLLQYLDTLTSLPIPGFGGKFSTKYGLTQNRQILTEMFDYIRSGVNLCDPSLAVTTSGTTDFSKQFTPAVSLASGSTAHDGYVLPTRVSAWGTRGFGRLPVVNNIGLVLYAYDQRYTPASQPKPPAQMPPETLPADTQTDVHMLLIFNFLTPLEGIAPLHETLRIDVTDPGFQLATSGSTATKFVLTGSSNTRFRFTDQGRDWGGYESLLGVLGTTGGLFNKDDPFCGPSGGSYTRTGSAISYEFHSGTSTPITVTGNTMDFYGGDLNFKIYDAATNQLLQSYTVNFPSSTTPWPVPLSWQQTNVVSGISYVQPPQKVLFWNRDSKNTLDSAQIAANDSLGDRNTSSRRQLDVIRGVELAHGDARIVACKDTIDSSMFKPSKGYFDPGTSGTWNRIACSLLYARNVSEIIRIYNAGYGHAVAVQYFDDLQPPGTKTVYAQPPLPAEVLVNGTSITLTSLRNMGWSGDIDGGMLGEPDGPFLNKPDEGFVTTTVPSSTLGTGTTAPYLNSMNTTVDGLQVASWDPRINGFFSPTRQMPSAIQFGSLPTGVGGNNPWQTLLFCPNSQADMVKDSNGSVGHPGAASPKDHLYLDLFTMPVVEPYAISEPFSTAGKINLNQRLIPFSYIKRETALHAILKNMMMEAIDSAIGTGVAQANISYYKAVNPDSTRWHLLRTVDVTKTLAEIAKVLDPAGVIGAGAFRSASEICNVFLIPTDQGATSSATYWSKHQLTPDNSREAPYNAIYPLLTTQSNTYQVHYRVQTLTPLSKKANYDPANDFAVTGEQRGSYILERYLDINNPDFSPTTSGSTPAVDATTRALNEYYKFRVLRHSVFAPGS